MSGPFGSQSWMYKLGDFYSHLIDNSARLDTNSYYQRTPSTVTNRQTWTWSSWVKRGRIVASGQVDPVFMGGPTSGTNDTGIQFNTDHKIDFFTRAGGTITGYVRTLGVFRDVASWYHLVCVYDATNATAADRLRIYVNGERQEVDLVTTLPQNTDGYVNRDNLHLIGARTSTYFMSGYLAEINFIDGQALDATYFGQNKSGVWTPKSYTGTYGTNGFYLDFATRATDPIDASGNGNNWSSVNVASYDWMLDSPTNNWSVLNAVADNGSGVYSEGNLKCLVGATTYPVSSIAMLGGKWYCEVVGLNNGFGMMGIIPARVAPTQTYPGAGGSLGYGYYFYNGNLYAPSGVTSYGSSYTGNDIISIALDLDGGTLTFYKNGVSQGTAATGLTGEWVFAFSDADANAGNYNVVVNFGQDSSFAGNKTAQGNTDANGRGDFYYSVPSGYLALCSANLDDPASSINPILNANPQDHFNTVLYTGNGASQAITGVGFQPDLVWLKSRSGAANHGLHDVLRVISGNEEILYSNLTNAGSTGGAYLSSFDSDGFTVNANASGNGSGTTYVGWNWKADGAGVSNAVGTLTSTVSANQALGMSIVTFTADGTNSTVGTGLSSSSPLDMVIIKRRDSTSDWQVGHRFSGQSTNFAWHLNLNDTSALSGVAPYYLGTSSTTAGHYLQLASGSYGVSSSTWVAYCFQEVKGVSKFGSYTGTGSADGPFVYCGFRPAFVMIKNVSTAGPYWNIVDSARETFNVTDSVLFPNDSAAESTNSAFNTDLTSNGFKVRNTNNSHNTSGNTYIFMAFAEMPFKYANAR